MSGDTSRFLPGLIANFVLSKLLPPEIDCEFLIDRNFNCHYTKRQRFIWGADG